MGRLRFSVVGSRRVLGNLSFAFHTSRTVCEGSEHHKVLID